jgi:hypothetical protein
MRRLYRLLLLLLMATVFYEAVPRVLPRPESLHAFGGEEVLFLQNSINSRAFDVVMVWIYSLAYVVMIYGTGIYILLRRDVSRLERYVMVFVIVQAMAMLTWWLFPVAPPRMAVEGVRDVRESILGISETFNPYPWGAFPSLHVANSVSAVLIIRFYGRRILTAWLTILLLLAFSTVYLGEHYWQDLVGGAVYSVAGYLLAGHLVGVKEKRSREARS